MKAFCNNGSVCEVEITGERKIYRDGKEIVYATLSPSDKNLADEVADSVYDLPHYVGGYIRAEYRGFVALVPARLAGDYVENSEGHVFSPDEWEAVVNLMDDDIREALHMELAPCTDQAFFTAYAAAHMEKYGEQWELDKANPVW